mmetsp:Transcript_53780/g.126113  ORF Transcript_53780/g.126113 Transcript_53780/m.126113 type:complete len:212 (+) Transcript_53780:203-838(+)
MDSDCGVKVGFGRSSLHGDADTLHHLTGICADHVTAHHLARMLEALANANELHHDPLLLPTTGWHRVLHGLELCHVDVDTAILCSRSRLREPASTAGRLTEHGTGHVLIVRHRWALAKHGLRHCHALHEGHWGQLDPICHIANGEDAVYVGAAVLIHKDLAALGVRLDTHLFQAEVLAAGLSAGGEHDIVDDKLCALVRPEFELATVSFLD